jgi:hypothetical protein
VNSLLIGKTSIEFLPEITELLSRKILEKPKAIPLSFREPKKVGSSLEYVLQIFNE